MVLIAYGLRAGEVAGLRLDDLDWANETLRVRRPKQGDYVAGYGEFLMCSRTMRAVRHIIRPATSSMAIDIFLVVASVAIHHSVGMAFASAAP